MFANLQVNESILNIEDPFYLINSVTFISPDAGLIGRIVEAIEAENVPELNKLYPTIFDYGTDYLGGEFWLSEIRRAVYLSLRQKGGALSIELSAPVRGDKLDHTNPDNTDELFWLDFVQPMRALAAVMAQGRAA